MTLWLWMSGKRNVSVCRGHELANALYFYALFTFKQIAPMISTVAFFAPDIFCVSKCHQLFTTYFPSINPFMLNKVLNSLIPSAFYFSWRSAYLKFVKKKHVFNFTTTVFGTWMGFLHCIILVQKFIFFDGEDCKSLRKQSRIRCMSRLSDWVMLEDFQLAPLALLIRTKHCWNPENQTPLESGVQN